LHSFIIKNNKLYNLFSKKWAKSREIIFTKETELFSEFLHRKNGFVKRSKILAGHTAEK